jgi:lipopolysaccharide/colanic/teichoic acid biosynthesis glycosyltransferase
MVQQIQDLRIPPLAVLRPPIGYRVAKRLLDIVFSGLLLLLLFPLFVAIALAVKLTSKGPILYRSIRIGRGGQPLEFLKFRTMYIDAEARKAALTQDNEKDGPIFKMKNDPRVTSVGRILRRYSLDELPQFIHVFVGDMSLVGPRPHLPQEVREYNAVCYERLLVKPGLTCFWQIMGRSDLTFEEWIDLDRKYVREMNFWLDMRILVKTPLAIIAGKGAY